jgi:hypothetical protein
MKKDAPKKVWPIQMELATQAIELGIYPNEFYHHYVERRNGLAALSYDDYLDLRIPVGAVMMSDYKAIHGRNFNIEHLKEWICSLDGVPPSLMKNT